MADVQCDDMQKKWQIARTMSNDKIWLVTQPEMCLDTLKSIRKAIVELFKVSVK